MSKLSTEEIQRISDQFGSGIPGLDQELKVKLTETKIIDDQAESLDLSAEMAKHFPGMDMEAIIPESNLRKAIIVRDTDIKSERIISIEHGARPVARIKNNSATVEFLGVGSTAWANVITDCKAALDRAIPTVGRVELKNCDLPWAGTGWLISENIIVTNAHVAETFAMLDRTNSKFSFRPGLLSGIASCKLDFLEEEGRLDESNFDVDDILYIAPPGEADVAFLKLSFSNGRSRLPAPVDLEMNPTVDSTIAAIGYPARDRTIDQKRVIQIFGNDVFDKKRLSPGKLTQINSNRLLHDCSTLGGNSGSLLMDLKTGLVVGLHQGGLLDDSTNVGVPASYVWELLNKVKGKRNIMTTTENKPTASAPMAVQANTGSYTVTLNVPIEITVKVGTPVPQLSMTATASTTPQQSDESLAALKQRLRSVPEVHDVRPGYKFRDGWITDEEVVVIEVSAQPKASLPHAIQGIPVEIRTISPPDIIDELGIDLTVLERPGKPAGYTEPPGFDNPRSPMFLGRVRRKMSAVFHVSPDAGFAQLSAFLGRVKSKLTATIYEWEPNHISDVLEEAMKGSRRKLKMVTQRTGVAESDATITAVEDMSERIGNKFQHVYASTRGENRLIPNSYHIKVGSRDDEEFWLSSGNWKESNQPQKATAQSVLRSRNREWHAVVSDPELAKLFERYIDYDFAQAKKFPTEIKEGLQEDIEFFVPVSISREKVRDVTYKDTLEIIDEQLDIQPLLTPDRDGDGDYMFLKAATEMIARATKSIYVQNQSFNFTEKNNKEFDLFFDMLKKKQRARLDVRVICRDAADYGRAKDLENQVNLIERLKTFGLDVSDEALRLQRKCHTKGIIVDGEEVLLGSQNLTNGGSLFNRDASLLVRTAKVAAFFEAIFLYDWDNLAHNNATEADESVGKIRRARPGDETPQGYERVTLSQLLAERQ